MAPVIAPNQFMPQNSMAQQLLLMLLLSKLQKPKTPPVDPVKKATDSVKKLLGIGGAGTAGGVAASKGLSAPSILSAARVPAAPNILSATAGSSSIPAAAPAALPLLPAAIAALAIATGPKWAPSVANVGEKVSSSVLGAAGLGNNENIVRKTPDEILSSPRLKLALPQVESFSPEQKMQLVNTLFESAPLATRSTLYKGENSNTGPSVSIGKPFQMWDVDQDPVDRALQSMTLDEQIRTLSFTPGKNITHRRYIDELRALRDKISAIASSSNAPSMAPMQNTIAMFPEGRPIEPFKIDPSKLGNLVPPTFSSRPIGFDEVSPGRYRRRT